MGEAHGAAQGPEPKESVGAAEERRVRHDDIRRWLDAGRKHAVPECTAQMDELVSAGACGRAR
eukprot:7382514-Prymnesium_polylepis.1